jgi:hypothetical protein
MNSGDALAEIDAEKRPSIDIFIETIKNLQP